MRGQTRLLGMTAALVFAVTLAHQSAALWSPMLLVVMFIAGMLVWWLQSRLLIGPLKLVLVMLAIDVCAFAYTQGRATHRLQQQIPTTLVGQTLNVTGTISSIPLRTPFGVRFIFNPSDTQTDALIQKLVDDGTLPTRISTAWYDDDLPAMSLKVGQEWRLPLGLKPPRATQNEGVFDQEQLWWADDVRGMATVRLNQSTLLENHPQLITTHHSPVTWLHNTRMAVLRQIDDVLLARDPQTAAVFKALTFGEQSDVSTAQWNLFQQTGITHLISISGVHITMLAALMAWCVNALWRKSPRLCGLMPSLYAAQWAGLLLALIYALFAGWALPAQRTVYMLALWLLLTRIGVAHSGIRVVCLALWGVLIFDPFAVLSIGFWLSFGAVAWLMLAFQYVVDTEHQTRSRRIGGFFVSQLAIGMAMLPATLYFFHQASLLGVVVNLIAIPLVSVVLVPMMLLACMVLFITGWSGLMVGVNDVLAACIRGLSVLIEWLPNNVWVKHLSVWEVLALTVLSVLLIWSVQKSHWRRVASLVIVFLGLVFWPSSKIGIDEGQVHAHVIDIGQGSAILLQTAHQNWLYDTGPHYSNDADAGARVIVPYLRAHGIDHLDMLILSHNDADHTGGAASIARSVTVDRVIGSMSREIFNTFDVRSNAFINCEAGQIFTVDSVTLRMMSPSAEVREAENLSDNSKSCVLRVEAPSGEWRSMLLTGDIDGLREAELVVSPNGGVRDWPVDVLAMPHHGSGASSTAPLIEATHPKMAFVQAGYLNPFRHPLPAVIKRYQDAGTMTQQSVDTGTLRFCLGCEQNGMVKWRENGRRYWWW